MNDYKYDIAFTLLGQDENTIAPLNDLLKDRLKTFFYPEREREVVGTDGEKTFSRIFQTDSRAVVIIYRGNWGSTRWTRIEQTAIRNRGFEEGYEFALMIPMERPVSTPLWFPKQHIWFDLDRLGITGAAAVIEQRVRDLGGLPKPETIEDSAQMVKQEIQFREERERYLESGKALADAVKEVQAMFDFVKELASKLADKPSNLEFKVSQEWYTVDVQSWGFILRIVWSNLASNLLYNSGLAIRILELNRDLFHNISREPPTTREERVFHFDINQRKEVGWVERGRPDRFFLSNQLAETGFKLFLKYIKAHAAKIGEQHSSMSD